MTNAWDGDLAAWWRAEVAGDPAYERDVDPLVATLVDGMAEPLLDLGCGDGRLLGRFGRSIGVDASWSLLRGLPEAVVANLAALPFVDGSFAGAYGVLVLEHLSDPARFFEESARVVASGGALALVANHPLYTAPGSGPFVDDDGEVLWRLGRYLEPGHTDEPASDTGVVRFYHRPLGTILGSAADAGWHLERLIERATGDRHDPLLALQDQVPRLIGIRWRRMTVQPTGTGG